MQEKFSPQELALFAVHDISEQTADTNRFSRGEKWFSHFLAVIKETEPGTRTLEQIVGLACDREEKAEGVIVPGGLVRPFRFCSP